MSRGTRISIRLVYILLTVSEVFRDFSATKEYRILQAVMTDVSDDRCWRRRQTVGREVTTLCFMVDNRLRFNMSKFENQTKRCQKLKLMQCFHCNMALLIFGTIADITP